MFDKPDTEPNILVCSVMHDTLRRYLPTFLERNGRHDEERIFSADAKLFSLSLFKTCSALLATLKCTTQVKSQIGIVGVVQSVSDIMALDFLTNSPPVTVLVNLKSSV